MDVQTRKLNVIQDILRYANSNILSEMEKILKIERAKQLEEEITPMTLNEYEERISTGIKEHKEGKITSAKSVKQDILKW